MAMERRNGRVYYYTSRRIGQAVVRHYDGAGPAAELCARMADIERETRKLDRCEQADRWERLKRKSAKLRGWIESVNRVIGDALRAAGWHQHRWEWRRKRGADVTALATVGTSPPSWLGDELAKSAGWLDPATAEKAAKGDRSVGPAVAEYLKNPAAAALWGDMGRRVLQRWVSRYAGSCLTTERALLVFANELRGRLAGPNADALVFLVAERVVLGWVVLNYFENSYLRVMDTALGTQHKFHLARIDLAHRSMMAACRTLAKVRRANLPDVLALVNVTPPSVTATNIDPKPPRGEPTPVG